MPIASWSDVAEIDPVEETQQVASFADIAAIEPAAPAPPRRATFADIVSIEPPVTPPAFSPLEQDVISASPARRPPTVESIFNLQPSAPIGSDITLPKDVAPPPLRPGRMGGLADTAPRSTTTTPQDIVGSALQVPVGVVQALPAAAGEQLAGTTLPGHEDEPPTLFGRAWSHLKQTAAGHGGDVLPQAAVTEAIVGNPAPTGGQAAPTFQDLLAHGPSGAAVNPKVAELARRGLGTAAKMLMDPGLVAIGAAPGSAAEAAAAVFMEQGVEAAVATATNPQATDVDVAEAALNALLMALPVGAHGLRAIRTRLAELTAAARPAAEVPVAEAPSPVPQAPRAPEAPPVAGPDAVVDPQPPAPGVAEPAVGVPDVTPPGVAHVSDVVAVEPPAAEPPRAAEPVAPEPTTAPITEIAEVIAPPPADVVPPAAEPPGVAHVTDVAEVLPPVDAPAVDVPQTSAAQPPEPEPPGKKERYSVRAPAVEWQDLDRQHQREVRRILLEMEDLGFAGKTFNETTRRGGDLDVKGRVAGAPVYWDIVGGNPKGRPTFSYDRTEVAQKIRQFIETGKRSVVSDLTVDVAERRLAGDRSLRDPLLPPHAGDEPGAVRVRPQQTLTPEESAVQKRAIATVENRTEDLAAAYRTRFGHIVGADNAKLLFDDYATHAQRTANDVAVHRPASRLAQHVYDELLKEPVPDGHDPYVVLTAGGTGSGKTTSLDVALPGVGDRAHVVYDSTLTDLDAAKTNIEAARDTGHEVIVVLTDREIQEAFRATLSRAQAHGRPVTLNTHVNSHLKAPAVFEALREAYATHPDVTFAVIRNSAAGRELVDLADWKPRRYDEGDVRAHLARILEAERPQLGEALVQAVDRRAADAARAQGAAADEGRPGEVQPGEAPGRPVENAGGTREVVDTLDTGEQQTRLPGAEHARQAGKADTSFRAPAQASGDDFNLDTPLTDEQKAADAKKAAGPSMFDEPLESARPFRGSWDRPPRLPEKLRDEPRRKPSIDDAGKKQPEPKLDLSDDGALSMPNPGKRADASGALVPSPASRALSVIPLKEKQLRPSEIVRQLSKHLDELPIKVGKFKQHALGIYKPDAQTIRLKVANDLDTLTHELGHHIHESLLGGEIPPKAHRDELVPLGLPTSRSSYTLKQKLQEGQAEFTRYYLSDPAQAQKLAPNYYRAFEAGLEKHPELAAILRETQRQYIGHLSLDPVERGMSHLDFEGGDPQPKADVVTRLQTNWVDDLYPLRAMVKDLANGQPIDYVKNGYVLARLARGASAKADGFLRHGVRSQDGTFVAPALEPALKPVRKQIREFAGYLAALRAVELRGRGMETGMTGSEARAIIAKYQSPAFDAARDAVYAYQDGLLHYARQSGTLSKEQLAGIKALNKAYVPFQRVFDEVGTAASGGAGGIANKGNPVKRIKGSGRDVVNPLESIVRNTHALVSMVEQNRAMQALVSQASSTTGGGRYIERIPEKQVATMFNLEAVAKDIREELDAAGVDYPDNLDFDKVVTVFTPTQFRMGEKGIASVLRDGKREWFAINDQALYDAIATIGPKSSDLIVNLLMKPARYLRAGATTTIGFIARNPMRDTFEATINSRYGFRIGYDTLKGLFEYAKKGDDYQNFLNSGAGNAAMVGLDRNRLRQELAKMGGADKRRFADSVILNPVNLLQAVSEAMEHATRLGEFKRALDTEGRTAEGYARAALAARDVTIDFARGGRISKEVNRYTAFFNAAVQGTARLAEVFHDDPVGATTRAVAWISVPTIALYALNESDPEYRELPDWERNTYWHIPLSRGAGHGWARLPKPHTLGQVFANAPEAALEWLRAKDPEALRRILPDASTAWQQIVAILPTALMPAVEVATNYDTFRDRAIVNPRDLQLDTELQYNRWTSATAKYVGPKLGIAPAKLDHLIYGYGAGLARGATDALDTAAEKLDVIPRKKPAGGAARLPGIGAFYREAPGADARSIEQFFRLRDRVDGAVGSIRRYETADELEKMHRRQDQARGDLGPDADATVRRVRGADQALTQTREQVNRVFANAALTPAEKKDMLDRLYEQMVNQARAGLEKPPLPSRFASPPPADVLRKLQQPKPSAPPARPSAAPSGVGSRPSVPPPARPAAPRPSP